MKAFGICLALILCCLLSCGTPKITDVVATDGLNSDFHRQHIGEILFSGVPPAELEYSTPEVLVLSAETELYFTMLLENSLTNYLHELAPGADIIELDTSGNYQFSFLMDGEIIYTSNLHPGAPTAKLKHQQTRLDKPFVTDPFSGLWSAFLWNRFMHNGGKAALTPGKHEFRLEVRPYIAWEPILVGPLIAAGDVTLDVVPPSIEGIDINSVPVSIPTPYNGLAVASQGPDIRLVRELRAKIEARIYKDVTSVVILNGGKIQLEEYYNGSGRESRHDVRSVGKTFASTMLGIAIADGHLQSEQEQLGEFYDLEQYKNYNERKAKVSLADLMTMSSSFTGDDSDPASSGNEEFMYPTKDWVRFTLDLPVDIDAVKRWQYFTAGVVVLGDVIHQKVPGGLEAYAERMLFSPLGITSQLWQHTPQGVANTAGGIQMTSLDFAKYGLLYSRKGNWGGQQVLPESWVDKSFSRHMAIPDRTEEYYGYLFWNKTFTVAGREVETYYCAGNGGNNIFVFPEEDLVVVITATAYNMPYAHPQANEIMEKHVLPAVLGE